MRAGDLIERVQVLRPTLVDDGFSQTETYAPHGDPIRARRRDLSDGERFRSGEVAGFVTARFVVRSSIFTRDLKSTDRLQANGVIYDIKGIKDLDDGRSWREITCAARTD